MSTTKPDRAAARASGPGAPGGLRDAYASAWIAVRRRSLALPGIAAVATFAAMTVVLTFLSASRPGGSRLTDPPTYLTDLTGPGALADLAGRVVMVAGACVLSVAAAHTAGAFVSGSIRVQMVRQPRRLVWWGGNLAAVVVLTLVLTVSAVVVTVVAAFVVAPIYDVAVDQWLTAESVGRLASTAVNLAGCLVGFAAIGAALAVRLRSAIATIGVALTYGLFEGLIAGVLPALARFLPVQNLAAMAQGGTADVPYAWSLVASACFVVLAVAGAALVLVRRDVQD